MKYRIEEHKKFEKNLDYIFKKIKEDIKNDEDCNKEEKINNKNDNNGQTKMDIKTNSFYVKSSQFQNQSQFFYRH